CRDRVRFTEEEVQKAYESAYGEKRLCQVIYWTPDEVKQDRHLAAYQKIRNNPDEFTIQATHQANLKLAASGGKLAPFGRYSQDHTPEMEDWAFRLKEGEVSPLLDVDPKKGARASGAYVVKCLKHIPPESTKKLEDVRAD